jgi:endoglucanase
MQRRTFLKNTGLAVAGIGLTNKALAAPASIVNKLPKWKGFNVLDFFSPNPNDKWGSTSEEQLTWMRDWGFDFIRIPIAYPHYIEFDRSKNIMPDDVYKFNNAAVDKINTLVQLCHKYHMHVSLNLHRAPGYCINAGFNEPYNLWKDESAQQAFYYHWSFWAKQYKNISSAKISFDLLNEPSMREDMNNQHSAAGPVPGNVYRNVAKAAMEVIKKENPGHLVIADGNNVGNTVISEITDLDIAQSCRGYFPHAISHYKAPWANKNPDALPQPLWPGQVGNQYLQRSMLETYYQPWIDLVKKGVGVHCGECGCWNKTPHKVFIAWFSDVLDILSANNIGFAIWNFKGDFGILNSDRKDVDYQDWYGHKLDKDFLTLLQKH